MVEGYEVVGSDDGKLGHVVEIDGDFLIAEEGTLRKKRHAIPKAFAHPDDSEQVVRLTVSKELVEDSPTFKEGELDRQAAAAHYGLAEAADEREPGEPALSAEQDGLRSGVEPAAQQRVASREGQEPGVRGRQIIPPDPHDPPLDRFLLPKAGLGHRGEDRVAVGPLVVPLQQHLAHQVRVRGLEALVTAQRASEAADAASQRMPLTWIVSGRVAI